MNTDNNFQIYQNSRYKQEQNRKKTLILDLDDTNNTHLGKSTKFNIKLREPFIIDKPSEIYLDNFLTFNANLGNSHTHAAFVLKIDEFNINNGVASNTSGDKLSGAIVIPNATNSVEDFFTVVVHKTKKFNYICDINPTTLHSINGQISDLFGNSIFHGSLTNDNNNIYVITGITNWNDHTGTGAIPLIQDSTITSINIISGPSAGTFNDVVILASVEVDGEAIYFSSSTSNIDEGAIGANHVTVTTSTGNSFKISSASDSLQLQKENGRFIAEFTIISKE